MAAVAQALDSAHALLVEGQAQQALDTLDAPQSADDAPRTDGRESDLLRAAILVKLDRRDEARLSVLRVWSLWWLSSFAGGRPTGHQCTDDDVAYNLERTVELESLLPEDFMPAFLAARFAMELGQPDFARLHLDTAGTLLDEQLRRDPESVKDNHLTEYWRVKTDCLVDLGDWRGVTEVLGRWLEVDPDNMIALQYSHLMERDANGLLSPAALATLSTAYRAIREGADVDDADRATWAKTMLETATELAQAERTTEASAWLECAVWLGCESAESLDSLTVCLALIGDYHRARESVMKLPAKTPADFRALELRVFVEARIDGCAGPGALATLADAYRLLTEGATLDPAKRVGWANDMYNAGVELGRAERYSEAASWLQCAIWINPHDEDYHTQLSRMRVLGDLY